MCFFSVIISLFNNIIEKINDHKISTNPMLECFFKTMMTLYKKTKINNKVQYLPMNLVLKYKNKNNKHNKR